MKDQISDGTILELMRSPGSSSYMAALDMLVRKYQDEIVGYCTNLIGDQSLGEDIAQEVFLGAYQSMSSFRQMSSLRTWLFAIARNITIRYLRRTNRRSSLTRQYLNEIAEKIHSNPRNEQEKLLREEQILTIERGIAKLELEDRILIMMRHSKVLSYNELAEIYQASVDSIRQRYSRALQRLRDIINNTNLE